MPCGNFTSLKLIMTYLEHESENPLDRELMETDQWFNKPLIVWSAGNLNFRLKEKRHYFFGKRSSLNNYVTLGWVYGWRDYFSMRWSSLCLRKGLSSERDRCVLHSCCNVWGSDTVWYQLVPKRQQTALMLQRTVHFTGSVNDFSFFKEKAILDMILACLARTRY